jgi:16S rRNA (guanine527-N7)-methyltransferase
MEKKLVETLSEAASSMGMTLTDRELNLFSIYYRSLLLWNKKINLVSAKSEGDIPIKHFIDSLTPLPFTTNKSARLLDIGTGAGFPGIPMKIVAPPLKVFLLEPSHKKTSFLKHIIRTLKLDEITVINNRAEHLMADNSFRDFFEVIVSRAAFKLPELLRISAFFLANDGIVIAMKGKSVTDELKDASQISETSGLIYMSCHDIRLPVTHNLRKIIIFKKARAI